MNAVLLRSLRVPLRSTPMVRRMASHPTGEELGLTGWKYYFNNETIIGRRNVVFGVYGSLFAVWMLFKLRKPKEEKREQAK